MKEELSLGEQNIVKRLKRATEIVREAFEIPSGPSRNATEALFVCKAYDELLRLEREAQHLEGLKHRTPG